MYDITIEQVKHQCRIEHDDENELLASYITSAIDYASVWTGQTFDTLPPSVVQACLMLIGHWYANREAVAGEQMAQVPLGVHHLLQPYRLMGV